MFKKIIHNIRVSLFLALFSMGGAISAPTQLTYYFEDMGDLKLDDIKQLFHIAGKEVPDNRVKFMEDETVYRLDFMNAGASYSYVSVQEFATSQHYQLNAGKIADIPLPELPLFFTTSPENDDGSGQPLFFTALICMGHDETGDSRPIDYFGESKYVYPVMFFVTSIFPEYTQLT